MPRRPRRKPDRLTPTGAWINRERTRTAQLQRARDETEREDEYARSNDPPRRPQISDLVDFVRQRLGRTRPFPRPGTIRRAGMEELRRRGMSEQEISRLNATYSRQVNRRRATARRIDNMVNRAFIIRRGIPEGEQRERFDDELEENLRRRMALADELERRGMTERQYFEGGGREHYGF
jgi:hypothetical protein